MTIFYLSSGFGMNFFLYIPWNDVLHTTVTNDLQKFYFGT